MSKPGFRMGIYWWLLALIALVAVLPLFTTLFAIGVATASGCSINESVVTPCVIGGTDWGSWLQFGGISVFYFLLTVPLAIVFFVVWLVVLLIHRWRFGKRVAA